jgi:transcriptional regulator with XRE-family HTH domain
MFAVAYAVMDATEEALAVIRVRACLRSGQARALRKRAGMSQADAERAVGANAGQVARWESGKNAPGHDPALRLSRLYEELEKVIAEGEVPDPSGDAPEEGAGMTHPFFERFPDPQASVPHSVSGHLAWTEGGGVAECGSEAVVTAAGDLHALRPVHLVAVDDFTSFAVALELSPEAAEALAERLADTARAVRERLP